MKTQYDTRGQIALITLNYPPVNGLGSEMRQNIMRYYQDAIEDEQIKGIVIASALKVFCGGADIAEFGTPKATADPALPVLFDVLEESPKIIVAAIHGLALGGGAELALACDYRMASRHSAMGLPEVHLGILPGAGGTQRLPRLIGVPDALDMILSGKARDAESMHKLGAIDQLSNADSAEAVTAEALRYCTELVQEGAPVRSCRTQEVNTKGIDKTFFNTVRSQIADRTRGFYAPERCIRAVEAACSKPLNEGLEVERALFMECMDTTQARAQQHIFFAQRQAGKIAGMDKSKQGLAPSINKLAIIGSGTMGGGIAMSFANVGIATRILDLDRATLDKGLAIIRGNYERSVQKKRLGAAEAEKRLACISVTTDYSDLHDVDLVIEAAIEDMNVKQKIFKELDRCCKKDAILASNTSTLDIDKIASATGRPEQVLGMHFFSPANVMRLLEIVRTDKTSDETLLGALQLAKRIKKIPIVVRNSWGFVGNRMLEPYGREACRLILEGATAAQIDDVLQKFGMAMGFPSMMDLAGVDIGYLIRQGQKDEFYQKDPSYAAIGDKLYELGRYGQKTGRGFYRYDNKKQTPDPEVDDLAVELAAQHDISRRQIGDDEILERCLYTLINEGAKTLEEGIAARASDIDVAYCFGYGFPVYKGGPMHYASELGLQHVAERLRHYRDALGDYGAQWLQPAKLLTELADKNARF